MGFIRQAMRASEGRRRAEAGAPAGLLSVCPCCVPAAAEARGRRRVLDLVELLEHPDMPIPPDLALRLSARLLAEIAGNDGGVNGSLP